MKKIYIVRHAKAEGQPFHSRLTKEGEQQAHDLASFLENRGIQAIYSSPFIRAVQTISPFSERSGLAVHQDERLQERVLSDENFDDWEDKLKLSFDDFSLVYSGGESNEQGMQRAVSFINELLNKEESTVVIVSHGNLTTLLLRFFDDTFGFDHLLELSNPDVYVVNLENQVVKVERIWS